MKKKNVRAYRFKVSDGGGLVVVAKNKIGAVKKAREWESSKYNTDKETVFVSTVKKGTGTKFKGRR